MANERIDEAAAARRAAQRLAPQLAFKHDPDLPISARREAIMQALGIAQVLIVAGDTGSGKSTQLPQYCLESGRGSAGLIAHTQPRRIAARALAARIAEELGQNVGRSVGFRVRFADQVSDATRVVLLTDGLLLAELASDPLLRRYDTVIVDEAHERTLNVDLLLGVLKGLLPRRPDLKVIVTSATLDVERMAQFFDGAPLIAVSGRSHPIEVRYRAMQDDKDDPDLPQAVLEACREIAGEPGQIGSGDILVFLPGEREINDVGELLDRELQGRIEVLRLYSRLSWEQQRRIFERAARQRIVLSTNIAETSITVPGIRAVIDSGLARISRYSARNRLQRLPIEPVSRASAEQRKGRCGRLGPGLCIRLYAAEDFAARAPFTEPEVLRTNLAALLLRLAADGLGDAESFPFIDPPDSRMLNDGYRLLQELQAMDEERRITRRGRAMARLPLDPRLSRALLESKRFRAQSELLAIVAGLSVPDPRVDEAPAEAAFADTKSEFSSLVKLWRAYLEAREAPRRELRRWCKDHHLSLLRLSEWDDVYRQVVERARDLGIVAQRPAASYAAVHRSLLAGFCSVVGVRGEQGEYDGTRGMHFHIFPGSPLLRRRARWIMAANIIETSRVFARRVAEIEPKWIEAAASHLLKREYLEPDWDEQREEVVARERVGFLGLVLSANRVVNFGPIAPEESRRIFAREALVYQRLQRRPDWLRENDAAVRAALEVEERLRTRGLLQNAEWFVEFYDHALPRQVSSGATLENFSRHLSPAQRAALRLTPQQIFARLPSPEELAKFPQSTQVDALTVPVEYHFAPGEQRDGASLKVSLLALPGLTRAAVDGAIPGLAAPRIEALLRSLPKPARRSLIPIAETAAAFLREAGCAANAHHLQAWLHERRGVPEALIRFDPAAVPAHLAVQLSVTMGGREIASGADIAELRRRCAVACRAELLRRAREANTAGMWQRFEVEQLPEQVPLSLEEGVVLVYPALRQVGQRLEVQYEWSAAEAQRAWRDGSVRLARAMLPHQERDLQKAVADSVALLLSASPYLTRDQLVDTLLQLAFRRACFGADDAPRNRADFELKIDRGRERVHEELAAVIAVASGWFTAASTARLQLPDEGHSVLKQSAEETRGHMLRLLHADVLQTATPQWLQQLPRYLQAEQQRWQRNALRGSEPQQIMRELHHWQDRLHDLQLKLAAELRFIPQLDELRFWIEEYRVSLYAQELKTLGPVSAARLEQRAAEIDAWLRR